MSVKILKATALLILASIFVLCLPSCSERVVNDRCVYDIANIISDEDEQRINDAAKEAENSRFIVVTHNAGYGTKLYGETVMRDMGLDESENTVIFVITVLHSTYYCNMYTFGTADRRISDSEVEDIMLDNDAVIAAVKSGRFGDAMVSCIESSNAAVEIPWAIIIIIALIIGAVAGGAVCGAVKAKYKMRLRPTNYPLDKYAKMELTDRNDDFINSRVTVQRISNGSSGRGGGRSGGGFGGGSGHRGGI